MKKTVCTLLLGSVLLPALASAQAPPPAAHRHVALDSGWVSNTTSVTRAVFTEIVTVGQSPWMRLHFEQAELTEGAFLQVTSLLDGKSQSLSATHLAQWQNSTAYFNGDTVLVEIIAPPHAGPNRVSLRHVEAGQSAGGYESQCGAMDDRTASSLPGVARLLPIGCTGWIHDDACGCFATAGHCMGGSSIVQFNVPPSSPGGTIVNPGPEHQYAVDPASIQSTNGGIGNDWAYFGTFPNSETGLTALEAENFAFHISNPVTTGIPQQTIRITGFGVDSGADNQVQQTHTGPRVVDGGANVLEYQVDTTGGNSGSPVVHEQTGDAIGIHTNAGCNTSSGSGNTGSAVTNPGFQNALASPQGVCVKTKGTYFSYGMSQTGTNIGLLAGVGVPNAGSDVGFRIRNIPNGTVGFIFISVSPDNIPGLGGTILAGLPSIATLNFSLTGGSAALAVTIPTSIAGGTLFMQALALDASQGSGVSLTNGVRLYVH